MDKPTSSLTPAEKLMISQKLPVRVTFNTIYFTSLNLSFLEFIIKIIKPNKEFGKE